jgi:hypothetical protein
MWGDGDDGVFGVVLAEGFCVCDISRSRSACEIAEWIVRRFAQWERK